MNIREQAQEIAALIDKRNGQGIKADEYVRLAQLRTQTNDDIARVLVRALDLIEELVQPRIYDANATRQAARDFLANLETEAETND